MIEKIDLEKEPFKQTDKVIDTLKRLYIIAEKINEIIDVINGKATTISINAVDAESFDEMVKNNPGGIVEVVKNTLGEDPPDDAA